MRDLHLRKAELFEELKAASTILAAYPVMARYDEKLDVLRKRFLKNCLQVAVLGQFKRGKSTFINALLGAPVLPSAVVPLTAVPTYIKWGAVSRASVKTSSGDQNSTSTDPRKLRDFLFQYISEEANPENGLGVLRADVSLPVSLLEDEIVLIDTPGVGSTFLHNTKSALHTISESDVVLFVLSSDPPISREEIDYLRRLRNSTQIFFILNKIDYLNREDCERVQTFLRTTLEQHGFPAPRIFLVSARQGLEAKLENNKGALQASGIEDVEESLLSFLRQQKDELLRVAVQESAIDILSRAESELWLRLRALTLPLSELSDKCGIFSNRLHAIEREGHIFNDVLVGEQARLREKLESKLVEIKEKVREELIRLTDGLSEIGKIQRAIPETIEHRFDEASKKLSTDIENEIGLVLAEHQQNIHKLVDDVQRSAADIFDIPFREYPVSHIFQWSHEPYWVTEQVTTTLFPSLDHTFDWLLPRKFRRSSQKFRFIRQLENLVTRNTENLRWALIQGLDETFRSVLSQTELQVAEVTVLTKSVLDEALARRENQAANFEQEQEELSKATREIRDIRDRLIRKLANRVASSGKEVDQTKILTDQEQS